MKIRISGQYGDPKSDKDIYPMQKKLNDCFKNNMKGTYFKSLVMFSVVFRVSGKIVDFGSEGPERMKYIKKDPSITIDLVFPERFWRDSDINDIKVGVSDGVRQSIFLMLEKAEELGEVEDAEAFKRDVEKAISESLDG